MPSSSATCSAPTAPSVAVDRRAVQPVHQRTSVIVAGPQARSHAVSTAAAASSSGGSSSGSPSQRSTRAHRYWPLVHEPRGRARTTFASPASRNRIRVETPTSACQRDPSPKVSFFPSRGTTAVSSGAERSPSASASRTCSSVSVDPPLGPRETPCSREHPRQAASLGGRVRPGAGHLHRPRQRRAGPRTGSGASRASAAGTAPRTARPRGRRPRTARTRAHAERYTVVGSLECRPARSAAARSTLATGRARWWRRPSRARRSASVTVRMARTVAHRRRVATWTPMKNGSPCSWTTRTSRSAPATTWALTFDLKPVLDALAERGRVIARKAYADWSSFDEDRRMLTRFHVELIEIPQRMGASRKNAADIKLAVDALEMAFERDYISTFVICTGDSDLTPLVHKLRELNKRVIGVGIKGSTSALLPPACDEFLFYDTLEGVDAPAGSGRRERAGPAQDERRRRARAARPRPSRHRRHRRAGRPRRPDGGGPAALGRRRGARLDGEARPAPQGPHVQRGRIRLPRVRRAAAPPGLSAT